MRILLVLLTTLCFGRVHAQHSSSLQKRWKVISIADKGMCYNFKRDSVAFSPEFSSPMDKEKARELIAALVGVAGEGIFVFGKDGHYEVLHDTKQDGIGSYTVSNKDRIITANVVRNGVKATEKMKFYIKEKLLHFTLVSDAPTPKMVLERLPQK
ncbi:hypothetical protein EXU57_06410 [Segetibacter sp. 3557_3]|uniref:hypothetical protein n=1 Tax=Segetibacter sp. 3557_3 TaxID=2547429 RepID=UPI00105852B2|nr:hypothetical protein [Segetibacter sp. 3557_3]TDH28088.1 hypothetical protein EXU57_06410 [Segetibacter sp. 3557_3]